MGYKTLKHTSRDIFPPARPPKISTPFPNNAVIWRPSVQIYDIMRGTSHKNYNSDYVMRYNRLCDENQLRSAYVHRPQIPLIFFLSVLVHREVSPNQLLQF